MVGWIKGLIKAALLLPIVVVAVLLAVANRTPVRVVLDPFARELPGIAYTVPLYALILGALASGVLIGGIAAWIVQGKYRRAARQAQRDLDLARVDLARARQQQTALAPAERRAA